MFKLWCERGIRNKVASCSLFRSRADAALDLFSSARRKRFCKRFFRAQQEGCPDARCFCSLRILVSCRHEHPGKLVYRVFQPLCTLVTQFQF